jgi:cell division protein FtsW (lipid II flippase)
MRRQELRFLLIVLLVMSVGFFLLRASYVDRGLPSSIHTSTGMADISSYFLTPYPNAIYGTLFVSLLILLHFSLRARLPGADPFILPAIAFLAGIGLIMALRLAPDLAISRNDAVVSILRRSPDARIVLNVLDLARLGMKHFINITLGTLICVGVVMLFGERMFSRISSIKYLWVLMAVALIGITLVFGNTINGRRLWLFGFQTVEIVKLLMLLFMASYVYEKGKGIEFYYKGRFTSWLRYVGPFLMMSIFGLLPIFIQKDFGPVFILSVVILIMFYYAGSRDSIAAFLVVLIFLAGYVSYSMGYPSIVRERFDALFDPFGRNEAMTRVIWAVSSGGLFGSGIGYGQPYRIPEVQSDFNFAAICEEMGFIGGLSIILALILLVQRYFLVSMRAGNVYKKTLAFGIASLTAVQTFVIIAGNLGVIPLTGVTLPFVSCGGSSLVVNFFMAGVMLTISGERQSE